MAALASILICAGVMLSVGRSRFTDHNPSQLASVSKAAIPTPIQVRAAYGHLPLVFEPNAGQTDERVKFLARGAGYGLFLTQSEAVLALHSRPAQKSAVLHMQLAGANPEQVVGAEPFQGQSNYLIGNDSSHWHQHIPQYGRVRYKNVYAGIDVTYYGKQGQLEYDFEVQPGADLSRILLRFAGQNGLKLDSAGDVVLETTSGSVRLDKPRVYQVVKGRQQQVAGKFLLRGADEVGFSVGDYDRSRTLVIDPVMTYSTYLGGTGDESCSAIFGFAAPPPGCPSIAVDTGFNIYITGATNSSAFPAGGTPFQPALNGPVDAFVTKLDPTGATIIYSTYLGGSGTDYPAGIGVNSSSNVVVGGLTNSSDFPTNGSTAAFQPTARSVGTHGFVTELAADGSSLMYSTYLSGNGTDVITGLALDPTGKIYVTGTTTSTDQPSSSTIFPATLGALQTASKATTQFFVSKIDPVQSGNSSLPFSTYFGGGTPSTGTAVGGGIAVDTTVNSLSQYNVYITGTTNFQNTGNSPYLSGGTDFPILNAFQGCLDLPSTTTGCNNSLTATDAFAAKLDPSASGNAQLIYSTYIGGAGADAGKAIAVDSGQSAYVAGSTASTDITPPTSPVPFQSTNAGGTDAYVAKLGAALSTTTNSYPLNYFSYLGGTSTDVATAIVVDSSFGARITGYTDSSDLLTQGAFQGTSGGGRDAFVARIDTTASASTATGNASSYLGGAGSDSGTGIVADQQGNTYVAGETASANFPVLNPFQSALSGSTDAFVTKLGPSVALSMTVTATPNPVGIGNQATFTYVVTNAGDQVTNAVFTDFVTNGTFAMATGPSSNSCGTAVVNGTVSCNLGALNAGATSMVTIRLTATTAGSLVNSAQVSVPGSSTVASASTNTSVTDFTISVSPPTNTVIAGVPAAYTATVSPTGAFPDTVSLSCSSGLPAGSTCTVTNGSSISNLNNGPQSRQIVINTTARPNPTSASLHDWRLAGLLPVSGLALFGAALGGSTSRRRRAALLLVLISMFSLVMFQAACSSGGSAATTTSGTPAGTYTITVSATSGSVSRSSSVALVVQ